MSMPRKSRGGCVLEEWKLAMTGRLMTDDDDLSDFEARSITLDGVTKKVFVAGAGPAVIVMTEMPGISAHVARFACWVRDAGFTVYMPRGMRGR